MRTALTYFFLAITTAVSAQSIRLKLASDVWPPFTNTSDHRAFAIDLVNDALNRVGASSDTEIMEFEQVMQGIKEGTYDGSAALWYSEEREDFLLFSAPYLQNQLILVGRKGADVSMSSFADLKGKSVAIVGTYAYGSEVAGNGSQWASGRQGGSHQQL